MEILAFISTLIFVIMLSVFGTLVAQYYGRREIRHMRGDDEAFWPYIINNVRFMFGNKEA